MNSTGNKMKVLKLLNAVLIFVLMFNVQCSKDKQNDNIINENNTIKDIKNKQVNTDSGDYYTLAVNPHDNRKRLIKNFKAFVDYLSEKLDKPVKLIITRNYDEIGKVLNENKVDFAIVSPTLYVKSKHKYPKIKYVATVVSKKTGKPFYHGVIITRKQSGIKDYRQLKNKLFAFVERSSGSGFVFPVSLMINKWGIDPKTYFKSTLFMGNHSNVVKAVLSGQAHAGATWEKPLEYARKNKSGKVLNVLLKSPPIPLDAFAVKPDTKPGLIRKLRGILLTINSNTKTSKGDFVTKLNYYKGFVVKSNGFYNIIRITLKTVKKWQRKWKMKK